MSSALAEEARWLRRYAQLWLADIEQDIWRPRPMAGSLWLVACFTAALVGWLFPADLIGAVDPARASLGPDGKAWLGTDHLGRDVLQRLLAAPTAFVGPGILAASSATVLGTFVGTLAGISDTWPGKLARYAMTVVSSIPRFVLALLAASVVRGGLLWLGLVVGAAYAPWVGEAVRARVHHLRTSGHLRVLAHHGIPWWRRIGLHTLWGGCARLVVRHSIAVFAAFLVVETTLSYLGGFGVQEPDASWGNMMAFSWGRCDDNPFAFLAPAVSLWITLIALTWIADGVAGADHA